MTLELLVTLGVFAPLLGAAIAGFFGRRIGNVVSQAVTTGLLFFSAAVAWIVFGSWTWGHLEPFTVQIAPFINVGDFQSNWAIRIDALSAVMLVVVTTVSSLVHLYSWGYMAEDPDKPRFFAYLSLFTFAMLALVTAADFMQLFFGWEGVGLASYLLIGFWYKKPTASAAAIKAFVVNRVGDFGFALGIFTVFWMFGTIQFAELFPMIASWEGRGWEFLGHTWSALDIAAFLLFIGAMGKSAQFFLHTWLPDAMEGPTPVSALIHAATMVTAGVYMVCLLSPLFEYAPVASQIVALIGGITALFAATVGLTQNDIKRVIAYSTGSQLGYMFFAAGVGAYQPAMFHLFTHAFFKALLFLGAGSVIHGMHHEQDMRKMGGLWKLLPITYGVMTIGTIAITGLGIPGLKWGFAGFYSKDSILESAFASAGYSPMGLFVFFIGLFAAGLTPSLASEAAREPVGNARAALAAVGRRDRLGLRLLRVLRRPSCRALLARGHLHASREPRPARQPLRADLGAVGAAGLLSGGHGLRDLALRAERRAGASLGRAERAAVSVPLQQVVLRRTL